VFSTESFLKTTTEQVELIAMNTADSTANHAILAFDAAATKGYDFSFDSYVLSQPGNTRPQLGFHNEYTANGVQVVAPLFVNTVNDMTLNDSYPLRFWSRSAGNYSFYLNQDKLDPNWTVYIEDTKLSPNVYTNITNTSYNFNYVLTDAPTRFILHFGNPAFTIKENTPESWGAQGWFNSSNDLVVKLSGMYLPSSAKVTVFDLAGKELFANKVGVTTEIIINNNYAPGVYMIRVEGSNGENRFIKVSKGI
jgi:hypothetical protein